MFKKIAAVAALIVASSSAFAVEPGALYAGLDAGKTKLDGWSHRETSVGVFGGYKFHPNVAAELNYRRLADADVEDFNVKGDQFGVSLIGSIPLASNFSVYGRLGYNRIEVDVEQGGFTGTDSTSRAVYGVGLGYAFTPAISGRIEVQKPMSDVTNLSAGVVFKF
ncbi:outer membrane beta-barrel protein [Massilia sp. ZL223]|uniref:outer membrane beta-barrel protein n=1 Tax=Massilia sp. ZL223 TaxID=2824904 RepID=UPI001B840F93|nr:outer membrane beta-barrel protein [Massilia sp. ZL223]MBQ5964727.1 outer membrane beta-barrel protein [Massilia sp. ZL223]